MRHGRRINHLSRTASHRKAMLSNMASSLILHKRITTTLPKAKALRKYVEPLLTKAKSDSTHSRRIVFSYLQNKESVTVLFNEIADRIAERPGGYTRILKTGARLGDNAETCIIELVDYNETMKQETKAAKAKTTRRSRRGGVAKKAEDQPAQEVTETVETQEATEAVETQEATETSVEPPTETSEESSEENTETDDNAKQTGESEKPE